MDEPLSQFEQDILLFQESHANFGATTHLKRDGDKAVPTSRTITVYHGGEVTIRRYDPVTEVLVDEEKIPLFEGRGLSREKRG